MNQIIKDGTIKIATYMGITDVITEEEFLNHDKKSTSSTYILESLKYHTDLNAIIEVVDKIEDDINYIAYSNKIESGYRCFFTDRADGTTYVMVEGCSTRIEAIFKGVVEFLDKYFSQDEKNRRIEQKRAKIAAGIDDELNIIWNNIGCDRPTNHYKIVEFIYEDVMASLEQEGFKPTMEVVIDYEDVTRGLRHWIEAQQK